jgi:ABC-2 type transport system permease protein
VINALRYEWVRLRTLRSTWVLSGITVLISVVVSVIVGLASGDEPASLENYAGAIMAGFALGSILMALLGVFAFGHEYRHGTIRLTLAVLPKRTQVMVAKAVVVAGWTAAVTVVALTGAAVAAALTMDLAPGVGLTEAPMPRVVLGSVLIMVVWSLVGLAYSGLFRNVPTALILLLVIPLIAESAVIFLLSLPAMEPVRSLVRFLPFQASQAITAVQDHMLLDERIMPWQGALTFGAFVMILLVLTGVLFEKRDA